MFNLVKFSTDHIRPLMTDPENAYLEGWLKTGHAKKLENEPYSWAGFVGGELMVIGGLVEQWPNRAWLWAVFSKKSKEHFVPVFRGLRKLLHEQHPFRRIEMAVPVGIQTAIRRASMLGFKMEIECAEAFLPTGEDCSIFSLVKPVVKDGK